MAPIYDSDIAAERFAKDQWRTTEFWDKVRQRERLKRNAWIFTTAMVVILLSGIPVNWERSPKWATWAAARSLATQIQQMQRLASVRHSALTIVFDPNMDSTHGLHFDIQEGVSCDLPHDRSIASGALLPEPRPDDIRVVQPNEATRLGLQGVVTRYCYDPLRAQSTETTAGPELAFVIAPTSDIPTESPRLDRLSFVLISPNGMVDFN